MRIHRKLPSWAHHEVVKLIFAAAAELGGEARIVGGAVRDWHANRAVGDIDMAVNMPIQLMAEKLCETQKLTVINTGLAHGTISVVKGGQSVDLTQTRSDVVTDGRHALVQFQDDWADDANRRDFTINAMYLDAEGQVFDPLGGQVDLALRRLRFVGRAADRVQEDALRMLRYCRFCIEYSGGEHDQEAVLALRDFAPIAADLSGERVAQELRRILSNENCAVAVHLLHKTGLDRSILGVSLDLASLPSRPENMRLVIADYGWLILLAAVTPQPDLAGVLRRLRLSRADQKFCLEVAGLSNERVFAVLSASRWQQIAYFMNGHAAAIYACAAWRCGDEFASDHYQQLRQWQAPVFPLSGADLLSHGVDKGRAVGQMLEEAKRLWVLSDFILNKTALLDAVVNR